MMKRILLVKHNHREDIQKTAGLIGRDAPDLGIELVTDATEVSKENKPDLVLALGGDGTILKAAEDAHTLNVPLLGINFGHMGFLAETSADSITQVLRQVAAGDYQVDPRMTLKVRITCADGPETEGWALNEAAVLSTDKAHPAEFAFAVDGQVVSTYAADGIILATPTGSTAYAFSAGGPVVWPDANAIVMAPLAAHGLFTRPLVVGPSSKLEIGVLAQNRTTATVWLDGRREVLAPAGTSIEVTRGRRPLRLVRLDDTPFSRRLVTKFSLPVEGWRDGGDKGKNG